MIEQYLQEKGSLTIPNFLQNIGFESLFWSTNDVPDIEQLFCTGKTPKMPYDYYRKMFNYDKDIYNHIIKPIEGNVTWTSISVLLHPKSRGTIKLKTNSPYDFPLIDPNYFSDPENDDLNTFVAAIKNTIMVSKTKAMQKYKSQILEINLPGCRMYTSGSDDYYACLVKYMASTNHHFSGTCKMGPSYDPTAVVGPDLKVHGVQNLRVADCSVIPVTISGHMTAVAYMIGEKAADIIIQEKLDYN